MTKKISQAEAERLVMERLTVPVPVAGAAYGLGRNASYEAVKAGKIKVLRFGKKIQAITAPIRRDLGVA